jgi:hypothetical protein
MQMSVYVTDVLSLHHTLKSVNIMGFTASAVSLRIGKLAKAHAFRPFEVSVHTTHNHAQGVGK